MAQGLRLCAPNAEGTGSISGWGTKISPATRHSQNKNLRESSVVRPNWEGFLEDARAGQM